MPQTTKPQQEEDTDAATGRYHPASCPRDPHWVRTAQRQDRTARHLRTRRRRWHLMGHDRVSFGRLKECGRQLLPATLLIVLNQRERERERERDRWRRAEDERIKCLVGEGVKASPGAPPWLAPLRLTVHKRTGRTNTTTTAMVSINLTSCSEATP